MKKLEKFWDENTTPEEIIKTLEVLQQHGLLRYEVRLNEKGVDEIKVDLSDDHMSFYEKELLKSTH